MNSSHCTYSDWFEVVYIIYLSWSRGKSTYPKPPSSSGWQNLPKYTVSHAGPNHRHSRSLERCTPLLSLAPCNRWKVQTWKSGQDSKNWCIKLQELTALQPRTRKLSNSGEVRRTHFKNQINLIMKKHFPTLLDAAQRMHKMYKETRK